MAVAIDDEVRFAGCWFLCSKLQRSCVWIQSISWQKWSLCCRIRNKGQCWSQGAGCGFVSPGPITMLHMEPLSPQQLCPVPLPSCPGANTSLDSCRCCSPSCWWKSRKRGMGGVPQLGCGGAAGQGIPADYRRYRHHCCQLEGRASWDRHYIWQEQ